MLIVLALVSILLTLGKANFSTLITHQQAELDKVRLKNIIQQAALSSFAHHLPVSFCLANATYKCVKAQGKYVIVFHVGSKPIQIYRLQAKEGFFYWQVFPKTNKFFTFNLPAHHNSNGTLWYCPGQQVNPQWAIAINKLGKTKILSPQEDGKIEDSRHKLLICI